MNIFKSSICAAVCAALIMQTNASADFSLNVKFDYDSQTAAISGNADSLYAPVLVRIIPQKVNAATLTESEINENQYPMITLFSDRNGSYAAEFALPDKCGGGLYNVFAASEENEEVRSFAYYKKSEIAELARLLNNADTSAAEAVLQNAADSGNIFIEEFENNKKVIAQLICLNRPSNGYSADNLADELRRSAAVAMLRTGELTDAERIIADYADSFKISYEDEYKNLQSKVKSDFLSEVKRLPLTERTTDAVVHSLIYARVKNCGTYVEMRSVTEKYLSQTGVSATEYNSLNENKKNSVFSKLFSKGISDFYDIETQLTALIKAAKEAAPSGGGSSSAGKTAVGGYSVENGIAPNRGSDVLFPDVQTHWSRSTVEKLAKRGVAAGFEDGTFRPDAAVTRAEFAALTAKAFNLSAGGSCPFGDCAEGDWFTPFVAAAYNAGIAAGVGGGAFSPNTKITREDCCVILYRALTQRQRALQGDKSFSDIAAAADYSREPISKMAANGIINGFNNEFKPKDNATRAEACTMIYNVLTYLGEAE